jgi:uncharacterized protein (TIGR02300 family)
VAKAEWGIKRICPSCGVRYYDLMRQPPLCPSCGTAYDPEALLKSRRVRSSQVEEVKKVIVPELEEDGDIIETVSDVDIEDASELDDDDGLGEVGEAIEGEEEN